MSISELIDRALSAGSYDERVGWRHQVLVDVAQSYGIGMEYLKKFKKTPDEKEEGLNFINDQIVKGQPVIVSLYYKLDPTNGGHMVVVQGLKQDILGPVEGYFIQDPDDTFMGSNYYLDRETFLAAWRGGMLWLKD